jgi:hypothetical protein
MVMTCRLISVLIVNVTEVLEPSTRRGAKAPPDLYETTSSKYKVTDAPVKMPVAPFAGTIEEAYAMGALVSVAGVEDVQMSFKLTVAFALEPAIKNM